MTMIAALPENPGSPTSSYRAIAGNKQSSGKTAGEALDALTIQMEESDTVTLVVLQHAHPDRLFTAEQQARLANLMARWREARDAGSVLSPEDQAELTALVGIELRAATERAGVLLHGLGNPK